MGVVHIYIDLREGGLSPAGACAVMGNMQLESGMRAKNAQDSYGRGDEEYTAAVDAGLQDFVGDSIGYGLCQWTYAPRKRKLLEYARSRGCSIGDEGMQVQFCLKELREDYPALYAYLCKCNGVYDAAARVCTEYERPAVNNIQPRAEAANSFFMQWGDLDINTVTPRPDSTADPTGDMWATTPATPAEDESGEHGDYPAECWPPRELALNMSGADVVVLQTLLAAHGYGDVPGSYGLKTKSMVMAFQGEHGLKTDGIAGKKTWAALTAR